MAGVDEYCSRLGRCRDFSSLAGRVGETGLLTPLRVPCGIPPPGMRSRRLTAFRRAGPVVASSDRERRRRLAARPAGEHHGSGRPP
jgi:hypothetical protein